MYGKLFAQMYDGTLATKGPWQALVTFQQLIILADKEGVVDMKPEAISRRTTIPLEIILKGIPILESPDGESRTPAEDGRRITKLSDTRDWGWRIVNYSHYRAIRSQEERREYMRLYQQRRRASEADNPLFQKKQRAHGLVYEAVRLGKLVRGKCEVCGSDKVDAHHDDYDKPLIVKWFCRKHHQDEHVKLVNNGKQSNQSSKQYAISSKKNGNGPLKRFPEKKQSDPADIERNREIARKLVTGHP